MSSRRTIVVGHRGQDGTLLCRLLRARGETVVGLGRDGAEALGGAGGALPAASLGDRASVENLVRHVAPTHVYYLAAHHRSSERQAPAIDPGTDLEEGILVNLQGPIRFLEALRRHAPLCRFFYASSSLIFGHRTARERQDESTPPTPECEYGLMKAAGRLACRRYREEHGLFASVGILYNHESALRPPQFLPRKGIDAALRISAAAGGGGGEPLTLGSLEAATDWGYAPDFVDAFGRILDLDKADDFIVATGEAHSVAELVAAAFAHLGLDWKKHVRVDPALLGWPASCRIGNPAKLKALTGWAPSMGSAEMIRGLVDQVAAAGTRP